MLLETTKDSFESDVTSAKGYVLVDFWGPSCVPCLGLMPHVEALAEENKSNLKVVKVDASKNRRLCIDLKVMGLPSFLLFEDGNEVDRLSGKELTAEQVREFIKKHV